MELQKKMYCDIKSNFLQFFSILIIAALGVFAYSGLNSVRKGLIDSIDSYYEETNMANLWVYANNPTQENIDNIKKIDGIKEASGRLVYTHYYDNKELELIVSEENIILKPYLIEGEEYSPEEEGIWLDRDFADANKYKVGDIININSTDVTVKGIILSSEKIYAPPSGEVITDFDIYGYAYMSQEYFTKIFGGCYWNQIVLSVENITDEQMEVLIDEIKLVLGDKYFTYLSSDDNSSVKHIAERKKQLLQFTYIFPALFYILAILTMFTTMKRIVEKQKIQIATMMSLGYSNSQILWHYMSYGIWIGTIGGILGAVVGYYVIPDVLIESFRHLAKVPYWDYSFTLESILAVLVMVLVCVIAIIISCYKVLKIMPAFIFRGNGNKATKHITLEKLKFWDKISFKWQMTLRNMYRNKVRTIMGIAGVLGSLVLVLAGLGMKDSFDYTVEATYNDFYKYTSKVQISDESLKGEEIGLKDTYQYIQEQNIELKKDKDDSKQMQAMITIVDKGDYVFVPKDDVTVNVTKIEGVVISRKLAEVLDVSEGEELYWRYVTGEWKKIRIGMIVESALPRGLFASIDTWEKNGEVFKANAILSSTECANINETNEGVIKVVSIDSQSASFQKVCDSSKTIVYILIFAAILLVVVVLVNLGIMNFTETYRDYATLKVLGLFPKEIAKMSFVENFILTMVGWLIGIPIAYKFVEIYMEMLSNDTLVCFSKIELSSFWISSLIIFACSFGVNLMLSTKLNTVDMVEALKANE